MNYGIKAQVLFNELKAKHIIGAQGKISLELLDLSININNKSATGNLLQE